MVRCEGRQFGRVGVAIAVVGGLTLGGVAWAAIPHGSTGVITACYRTDDPNRGALRVIDAQAGATCATGESKLTWNQRGINWKGPWDATSSYAKNDAVAHNGGSYLALTANVDVVPTNTSNWAVLAAPGATGSRGPAGPTGPVGPSNVVGITQSIKTAVIPTTNTQTWQFLASPVPIDVSANDTLDVHGIFAGGTHQGGGDFFEAGICYRRRGDTAAPGGPIGRHEIYVGDIQPTNAVTTRVLFFPSARSIEVGYCARGWTEPDGWFSGKVTLTIRHFRGVAFQQIL
jgi:hypothetical protein